MILTRVVSAGVCIFACAIGAATEPLGGIRGTFVLKGEIPGPLNQPLVAGGAGCAARVPDEMLVVDPATKGIANVFVWVAKIDPESISAAQRELRPAEVVLDNQNCQFVPHCLVAREGQALVMLNADAVAHNVHTNPLKGPAINQLVGANDRNGVAKPVGKAQTLPTVIQCDIHPWMTGYMLVLDHPYAALSDGTGGFEITRLPPGNYDLKVWHEAGGYVGYTSRGIRSVDVVAGETTDLGKKEIDVADMKQLRR